jgi:hypothetical protein
MKTPDYPNGGYDEFLDAVAEGAPYYLECANGHGHLPPRRVCPDCGSTEFAEADLPTAGEVETYNVTHVAQPSFEADVPYVVAIADFGPVRLTGQVRADPEDVGVGAVVEVGVGERETTGEPILTLHPR